MPHLLTLSGSRNPAGQTAHAIDALADGYAQAGGTSQTVFLPARDIQRCRQCDDQGWGICRNETACVIDDDLPGLVDQLRAADALVLATPVYYSDLAESLRAFLDRLRRMCEHGTDRSGIEGTPTVGLCVAGGGGGGAPAACVQLEKIARTIGLDVVDLVPVRRQNLPAKTQQLALVGRWLATGPRS